MNRVADLIKQCAPNGIEYKPLRDVGTWAGGITPSKFVAKYWDGGTVPWVTSMDISRTNGSEIRGRVTQTALDETSLRQVPGPSVAVVMRSNVLRRFLPIGYIAVDTAVNQDLKLLRTHEGIDARYVYWALQAASEVIRQSCVRMDGSMAAVNSQAFFNWRIPVPPLVVQREVVKALDLLAKLQEELETELEEELKARRLQYAFYRDRLVTSNDGGPAWRAMGEVGTFIRGRRFTKNDVVENGIPSIHYGEIYTRYGTSAKVAFSFVRNDLAPRLRFANPGDVVIAAVGETVEDVAKAVAWLGTEPVAIHDDTFLFRSEMNPKFVSYYMQTAAFHAYKNRYVARAKVKRLSAEGLAKIPIPTPPMDEQDRIVEVLDKFDALVNDLSSGLPAEIQARRKQYEHYRDRLLSFEEATV